MDHNAVLEFVDDNFEVETQKYVDDMTTIESIPRSKEAYYDENENKSFHAEKTENMIKHLQSVCDQKNLKINTDKTQLLAISANREKTSVWIQAEGEEIQSRDSLKLLGFHFGSKPDVSHQVAHIKRRAMTRFFVLRYYSAFMPGSDLRKLYCGLVCSVIEYSSVTATAPC